MNTNIRSLIAVAAVLALSAAPVRSQEGSVVLDDVTGGAEIILDDVTEDLIGIGGTPGPETHIIELTFRDGDMDVRVRIRDGKLENVSGAGAAITTSGENGTTVVWTSKQGGASLTMKETKIAADAEPKSRLGVFVDEVPEALAHQLGVDAGSTLMINSVNDGGAAAQAGLEKFDVVVGFDGTDGASRTRLRRLLCEKEPGRKLDVTVLRRGERLTLDVTLEPRPAAAASAAYDAADPLWAWHHSRINAIDPGQIAYQRYVAGAFTDPTNGQPLSATIYGTAQPPVAASSALTWDAPAPSGPKKDEEVDLGVRLNRLEEQMNRLEALLEKITR